MSILVFLSFATPLVLLAVHWLARRRAVEPIPAPARPKARNPARARERPRPDPWDEAIEPPPALDGDELSRRLRDRYIAARFAGVAGAAQDLADPHRVIRCARLYFEEDAHDLALELLTMAIDLAPGNEALRLAQLEITFLRRAPGRYTRLAREFHEAFPASGNWPEVARLGRALAPEEPLFASPEGPRAHDHYGPWPDLPNWIQASWDLTAEVLASDFHHAVLREEARAHAARPRIALGA